MAGFADIHVPQEVARAVVQGDRAAMASAYRLLVQAVMNLAARILQDRPQAEEVVQDTFMELLEKSRQIKDPSALVPWVRRVAVNHCLMKLRSPWHGRRDSLDLQADEQAAGVTDGGMAWAGSVSAVERALASLSSEARTVLWLHDVEGYTHREIGELMGKTASFSKSQLARAYERLLQSGPGAPVAGTVSGAGEVRPNPHNTREMNSKEQGYERSPLPNF